MADQNRKSKLLPFGLKKTVPPFQWRVAVMNLPNLFVKGCEYAPVNLSSVRYNQLVNEKIDLDEHFKYVADGKRDSWGLPRMKEVSSFFGIGRRTFWYGDCDDYAIGLRDRFINKYAVYPGCMRLIWCIKGDEGHLVLGLDDVRMGTLIFEQSTRVYNYRKYETKYDVTWYRCEIPGAFRWSSYS